jgi:hypothetical protein
MKRLLEKILPVSWVDRYKDYKNKQGAAVRKKWERQGKPLPPPHTVKQEIIRYYQQRSGYKVLVETGTYKGDMILAQRNVFARIYSIELSGTLFEKAKKRFRDYPHVTILQGDSGYVISQVLKELKEPAIFWLDGHYSGGITASAEKYCPVNEELESIVGFNQLQHIVLIDDARCFTGALSYPTIEELTAITRKDFPGYDLSVDEDIIRMVPEKFL